MAVNKKTPVRNLTSKTRSNVGGSSLGKKTTLFSKRNGLIVAGLAAIVGLAFVALSFASTAKPYQYAANGTCDLAAETVVSSCVNKSADAVVYRMYKALLKRNPDPEGYKYWVQALAGDKISSAKFVQLFVTRAEVKAKLEFLRTDKDFVTYMYQNFEGRDKVAQSQDYWVKRLSAADKTKISRNEVIRQFAFGEKSAAFFESSFVAFVTSPSTEAPGAVTYVAEGVYVEPTVLPACNPDQNLVDLQIDETSRYSGGAIKRYGCLAKIPYVVTGQTPNTGRHNHNQEISLVCPSGYTTVTLKQPGQPYVVKFDDGSTLSFALEDVLYKACKKS